MSFLIYSYPQRLSYLNILCPDTPGAEADTTGASGAKREEVRNTDRCDMLLLCIMKLLFLHVANR